MISPVQRVQTKLQSTIMLGIGSPFLVISEANMRPGINENLFHGLHVNAFSVEAIPSEFWMIDDGRYRHL
jgi:hypothetical protein